MKCFASPNGVNPHMKVLGAAFVTLIRMGASPLPRPYKRCDVQELAERARACHAATASGCDELRERCVHERHCVHGITR